LSLHCWKALLDNAFVAIRNKW